MYYPNDDIRKDFKNTFNVDITAFCEPTLSAICKKFYFDIIKFDEYLHKHKGYTEEKHGSIKDFIKTEYGDNSVKVIEKVMDVM